MSYKKLAWDSAFFDIPIGRVDPAAGSSERALAQTLAEADADGISCLYLLLPADDVSAIHLALAHGFLPYDVRVELELDLAGAAPDSRELSTRPATEMDVPALERLAAATMRGTRFTADARFPPERVGELYATWARRGVLEPPAHRAFVTQPDPSGFIVCGIDAEKRVGSIELIGVAPEHGRRGRGSELVATGRELFLAEGCVRATVVTQAANIAALRLYEAHGYRARRADWWLHRWR